MCPGLSEDYASTPSIHVAPGHCLSTTNCRATSTMTNRVASAAGESSSSASVARRLRRPTWGSAILISESPDPSFNAAAAPGCIVAA
ncbi:hypothetical protein D3C72_720000 [compost metagenome]